MIINFIKRANKIIRFYLTKNKNILKMILINKKINILSNIKIETIRWKKQIK